MMNMLMSMQMITMRTRAATVYLMYRMCIVYASIILIVHGSLTTLLAWVPMDHVGRTARTLVAHP